MRLPLHVFTIALDAMPWLACTFAELNKLTDIEWRWSVAEGAALPNGSSKWMSLQKGRLSNDGTTEFLEAICPAHPRVDYCSQREWMSKDEMVETATEVFKSPGVLIQIDGDELWSADQLRRIVELFEDDPSLMTARFHCRYFLGPNIRSTDAGKPNEWLRAWRFTPGMKWLAHEPPNLAGNKGKSLSRQETAALGLVFDHYAYGLPKHVAQKEALYGARHRGLMDGWRKLQANTEWPVKDAGKFLPKAFAGTPCDKIFP